VTGVLTALIAGGFTVTAVRLTQRHAADQRRLDRLEDRRVEQREALVEVLATGREFVTSLNAVMLAAGMTGSAADFASTSVAEAHGPLLKAHDHALLTARLLLQDPVVIEHVTRMSLAMKNMPELLPPLMKSAKAHGRAQPEVIGRALGTARAYGQALDDLERLTRERVVDDPHEVFRRWWQRVRLPLPGGYSRPRSEPDGTAKAA